MSDSTSQNAEKRQAKEVAIGEAYEAYLKLGEHFLNRARTSRDQLEARLWFAVNDVGGVTNLHGRC